MPLARGDAARLVFARARERRSKRVQLRGPRLFAGRNLHQFRHLRPQGDRLKVGGRLWVV